MSWPKLHVAQLHNIKPIEDVLHGAGVYDDVQQIHAVVSNPLIFFDKNSEDMAMFCAWCFVSRKLCRVGRANINCSRFHTEIDRADHCLTEHLFYRNANIRDLMYGLREKAYLQEVIKYYKDYFTTLEKYFFEYQTKVAAHIFKETMM